MLKYPISTILYLAKLSIKDKIQDILKIHNNIDIRLTVTVKDKEGKIIKVHKQKSHSFLMNFLAIIATVMANPYASSSTQNFYAYRNTEGIWWTISNAPPNATDFLAALDSANDSRYGIVVGTGTATPTPNDFNLENQIVNGTGNGQLIYGSHTLSPPPNTSGIAGLTTQPTSGILTPSGNTTSWQISRTFQNQSGTSITVSETGIIVMQTNYSGGNSFILIIHDLLSSPITVPNLSILLITYTISITT